MDSVAKTIEFDYGASTTTTLMDRLWGVAKGGAIIVIVLSHMATCSRIAKIADNRAPAFVQMATGDGLPITKQDSDYRRPELVKGFVKDWLTLSFNWDAQLDVDGKPIPDKGQSIGTKKVPTDVWVASFVLDEPLRAKWLSTIAERYELTAYLAGNSSRVLRIQHLKLSKPKPGLFQVTVIATWFDFQTGNKTGQGISFNRNITLQAIEQANPKPLDAQAGPNERAIHALLLRGLLITEIKEYKK